MVNDEDITNEPFSFVMGEVNFWSEHIWINQIRFGFGFGFTLSHFWIELTSGHSIFGPISLFLPPPSPPKKKEFGKRKCSVVSVKSILYYRKRDLTCPTSVIMLIRKQLG